MGTTGPDRPGPGTTRGAVDTLPRSRSAGINKWLGLAVVGVLTAMLCAPFLHNIIALGDEGVLLHGADRMLRGETLYLDFFEFLPPGGFYLTAGWLAMTGVSFVWAQVLVMLFIVGIACLTYLAGYRVSRSATISAIAVLAWAITSQGDYTSLNHHWFTTLFCVATLWATLSWVDAPRARLLIVAGLTGGAAAMVTPTRGALALLAGLAAFSGIRRHFGALATYCLTAVAVPTLLVLEIAALGALGAAFDSVIVHTATRYSGIQPVPYGAFANPQSVYLNAVFPLVAFLAVLHVTRDWRAAMGDRMLRVSIAFALAGFVGIAVRPDRIHIAFAAPLALPLLVQCVSRLELKALQRLRPSVLVTAVLVAALPASAFLKDAYDALQSSALRTPRGTIKLRNDAGAAATIQRIMDLPRGDAVFFYPYMPLLPFLTARMHPARVDIFTPNYTTPAQYGEACVSVLRTARWIVIDHKWTSEHWQRMFPAMQDPKPPERIRFEHALEQTSASVARDGNFELRRLTNPDMTACRHIADESG